VLPLLLGSRPTEPGDDAIRNGDGERALVTLGPADGRPVDGTARVREGPLRRQRSAPAEFRVKDVPAPVLNADRQQVVWALAKLDEAVEIDRPLDRSATLFLEGAVPHVNASRPPGQAAGRILSWGPL
jgi:hypothetical protein